MHLSEYALEKLLAGETTGRRRQAHLEHLKRCDRCSAYIINSRDMVMDFYHDYPSFARLRGKNRNRARPEAEKRLSRSQSGFIATDHQHGEVKNLLKAVRALFQELSRNERALAHTPY